MAKGKGFSFNQMLILIVVVVGVLGLFMYGTGQLTVQPTKENEVTKTEIDTCESTTTPSLDINAYDQENPGTASTEATNIYRIVGQKTWTSFTQGTAFAANVGDELEIVMGISTSDFVDNAYGQYFTYTVPCAETPTIEKAVANDEVETSVTATFYNADDNAAAETFLAGQSQTVEILLQAGSDEFFGNPFYDGNPNVLALKLNSTDWDRPEKVNVKGGVELSSIDCPQRINNDNAASGYALNCYELPVINDDEMRIELKLKADDSNAPATDGTAYMYAGNYYIDSDTSKVEFGVATEDDAAVGTDAADSVTLDFTA